MWPVSYSVQPLNLLRTEVDKLFDDFFVSPIERRIPGAARRNAYPSFNGWESQECYFIEAECPGLAIDDLELSITGNQLSVSGQRKFEFPDETIFHRRERGTGRFNRVLSLPSEVQADKVEASLQNGVLTIRLPKAESAKPRKIEVKN